MTGRKNLVKSGIPGLDKLLGGGFLQGQIITLSGPTGCGKSTLGMQFLYNGITMYGEPGLYIAIEESKESMEFHMSGYDWDLGKVDKAKHLIFLDYPVYEVDQFLNQYSAIQEIIQTTGVKRVVIDSIMPVALHFKEEDERKKGFLKLIDNLRRWGVTIMIISEDTPATMQDVLPETRYGIETFTDAWLHIYYLFDPKKKERKRAIEVLKMKGAPHSTKIHPLKVDNSGMAVLLKPA